MKDNFEIKYKIIPSHLDEMRNLDLREFNYEYTSVYGNFRMIFDNNIFIDSMIDDATDEICEFFSESVSDYLDALIGIFENIEIYPIIHFKYLENNVSWLKFVRNGNEIEVYEIKIEYNPIMNQYISSLLITNSELFKEEEYKWGPVLINKKRFKTRIIELIESFIADIEDTNPILLEGNSVKNINSFYKKHFNFS